MIRVLEVFGEPISRGGQESYVISALTHMDLSDMKVDMFTPYYCDNSGYIEFIESKGGKITEGKMPFVVGGTRREIIPVFTSYLNANHYDVVHIHSGSISVLAYYARVASKSGARKVIVHSHSSGVKENIKHFLMKLYASVLFKKYATDFCACSVEAAKWKFPKSILPKVKILNNGVDLDVFKYNKLKREILREEYFIEPETIVIGHVGRFTREKNQVFLIELLSKYIKKMNTKEVILMLVGDGVERVNCESRARDLGVADNVLFVGARDNVNEYMQAFDVFLLPSLYEGLGIVGIEAQTAGLPIIASRGVPKTMKLTDDVYFLDLNDIDIWIKKLNEIEFGHKDSINYIKIAGFDIRDSSSELKNIYLNSN